MKKPQKPFTGSTVIAKYDMLGLVKGESYIVEALGNCIHGLTVKINGQYQMLYNFS